ncbi:MAG: hypothetical protein QNI99_07485 [Woeseiaceae bacterium]|nr:hypothetical protein [Woeseiaceae bacterium]
MEREFSWEGMEEFLGQAAIQDLCDPEQSPLLADMDDETCRVLSINALDHCREQLSGLFPEPQRLGAEFLDQFAETITGCVEGNMLSQKLDLENEAWEAYLLSQEPEIVDSWSGAIDRIVAHYAANERELNELLDAFGASNFDAVFSFSGVEVMTIAATRTGDTWTRERLEDPPAWMLEMEELDIDVVQGVSPILMASGLPGFETRTNGFIAFLFTDSVDEYAMCDEVFESLECGACVASRMDGLTLAVSWTSKSLVESLADMDSEEAGPIIDRCISEGAEQARVIERRAPE